MLVLSGVALLATVTDRPALAAFPGENGRIAFDSNRDGDFEIFRMNADGSRERRLTNNDDTDYGAAFSPNGKRIAFYSQKGRERRDLPHEGGRHQGAQRE